MKEQLIDLTDLRFSDNRTYGGEGDIKILAEDINSNGLINPITVKPAAADKLEIFEVVAGRRRIRAVTMLGWKTIPCRILEGNEIDRAEEIAGAENINRLAMHPLDEASIFKKLLENGEPIEGLAKRFDRTVSAIWQRIQLLGLEDNVKTLFRKGALSLQSAAMLNSLDVEGQNLFHEKYKDAIYDEDEKIEEWEVRNFISGLNHDRLYKCVIDKQCETCKTRTYFTDANLFPELSSMEDSCLNHVCYLDKWIKLLERKIKSLKGEAPSHTDSDLIVSSDNSFRKIFGKTVTLNGVEYKILHDHWETRAEKEGKNTYPCFCMEFSGSGKLEIKPSFRKDPKAEKSKKEESKFTKIVSLLDLPKDETTQTIAAFESKIDPKKPWDNTAHDVETAVKRGVLTKILEIKAQQADNDSDIDRFLDGYFKRHDNKKILQLFTGTENFKDARKLSIPKLFALMNALDMSAWSLPDFDSIATVKKHDSAEWAGITVAQIREMYREGIKAQVPPLKKEKKTSGESKPEAADKKGKKAKGKK